MKKYLDKRTLCLTGAAILLAGSTAVGSAMAYFTTYATASGGAEVSLGFTQTVPEEKIYDGAKHIVIKNQGDYGCFVRVKVLTGDKYKNILDIHGDGWTKDAQPDNEGFYFYTYKEMLPPDGSTAELTAEIKVESLESTDDFNVIVVQESTPALYDEKGNPYADWNVILDTVREDYN